MTNKTDPNYLAENKGPWLYAIFCSFWALSIISSGLRFYTRQRFAKTFQPSDYILMVALTTTCGTCVMIHMQIQTGMGRHIEYSEAIPGMLEESMKVGYAQNILYQMTVGIVKSTILSQYYYVAVRRIYKRVTIGVWIFVVVFCLFVTLSAALQCIPVSAIFNPDVFPEGCWDMMAMNLATSSINLAVDVVIFALPIPVLIKLNMSRRKKLNILATYFFGSLSLIASALRISGMVLWNGESDFTYVSAIIPIYDAVEINTGIICACVPWLRPLVKSMMNQTSNSAWADSVEMPHRLQTPQKYRAHHNQDASSTATISQISCRREEIL